MLQVGNCLDILATLPDESIDSIVTDPPYELGFMGKSWDSTGVAYNVELWKHCLRVLKPGGHLLAFGGSRTYHRLACAIEDAGFQIRDQIMWVYGSGFPKSVNIGKQQGCEDWQGWGTALKPAHEPIAMARKPLESKTIAESVLTYGTGGINIDGCRVPHQSEQDKASATPQGRVTSNKAAGAAPDVDNNGRVDVERPDISLGRWPANFIHDGSDDVLELFPDTKGGTWNTTDGARPFNNNGEPTGYKTIQSDKSIGSAARFFYCAKASTAERNFGLNDLPLRRDADRTINDGVGGENPRNRTNKEKPNFHPTVKPVALMRHLICLVTPKSGIVLDPFLGSGTTAVAATLEGIQWFGCELSPDYAEIIKARVVAAEKTMM